MQAFLIEKPLQFWWTERLGHFALSGLAPPPNLLLALFGRIWMVLVGSGKLWEALEGCGRFFKALEALNVSGSM